MITVLIRKDSSNVVPKQCADADAALAAIDAARAQGLEIAGALYADGSAFEYAPASEVSEQAPVEPPVEAPVEPAPANE